jgi:hypothetical protein
LRRSVDSGFWDTSLLAVRSFIGLRSFSGQKLETDCFVAEQAAKNLFIGKNLVIPLGGLSNSPIHVEYSKAVQGAFS